MSHAADASAQQNVASSETERREVTDQASSYLLNSQSGYAPQTPGDSDLGEQLLLTRKERYRAFNLYGDFNEYWTSNATLSQDDPVSDWLMVPQVGLNYTPKLVNNLFGELTARQQLFRYADNSQLNFNSFDTGAGLIYVVRQLGDLAISARYHFSMLTPAEMTSVTYNDQTLKFGVQKPFVISRAHFVYVGTNASIVLAGEPRYALRNDFSGYVGYQLAVTRQLNVSLFYRISLFNYVEGSRDDLNQSVSMGLAWNITNWLSINSVASFAFNNSNTENNSYSSFMVGSGVSAQIKF